MICGEILHANRHLHLADCRKTVKMSSDTLFTVRNSFYIGAYQAAIAEAADLDTLNDWEKIERDFFVYRSYIELGSYEVNADTA